MALNALLRSTSAATPRAPHTRGGTSDTDTASTAGLRSRQAADHKRRWRTDKEGAVLGSREQEAGWGGAGQVTSFQEAALAAHMRSNMEPWAAPQHDTNRGLRDL